MLSVGLPQLPNGEEHRSASHASIYLSASTSRKDIKHLDSLRFIRRSPRGQRQFLCASPAAVTPLISQLTSMANVQTSQAFYALTLEPSSAPTAACTCNVIPGLKAQDQQIFEARGQHLLLHRITENEDKTEVKVVTVIDQDVFGIVRGVGAFRIPGTSTGESESDVKGSSRHARVVCWSCAPSLRSMHQQMDGNRAHLASTSE